MKMINKTRHEMLRKAFEDHHKMGHKKFLRQFQEYIETQSSIKNKDGIEYSKERVKAMRYNKGGKQ